MKIFITGASGFIGSHLIKGFLVGEHEIYALSRYEFKEELNYFPNKIKWIRKNIWEIELSDLKDIDIIIHLACAGVSPKIVSWEISEKVNVASAIKLITLAKEANVKRIICAGTCLEYGEELNNWDKIPSNAPLRPIGRYAVSKAACFSFLKAFAIENNIELFYGRIFSAYGEGQFAKNLWPSLYSAAISNKDFCIKDGKIIRDFIKVEKVCFHLMNAIIRKDINPGEPLVVNIGSGEGIKIIDFAKSEWIRLNAKGKLYERNNQSNIPKIKRMVACTNGLV